MIIPIFPTRKFWHDVNKRARRHTQGNGVAEARASPRLAPALNSVSGLWPSLTLQSTLLILPTRRRPSFGTVAAPGPIRKRLPSGPATVRNLNQVELGSNIGFLIDRLRHFTHVTQSLGVCYCICNCSLSELLRGLKNKVPGTEPAPGANPALSSRLLPPERL